MPKGMIQTNRKGMFFCSVLILFIFTNISLAFYNHFSNNIESFQILSQIRPSYESSLDYGEYAYLYKTVGKGDKLNWEFSGTNNYVGIIVYAMTDTEFVKFQNFQAVYSYTLSDGSYYKDFGRFFPPSYDIWYIVFLNLDSDLQITYLTYNINAIYAINILFINIFVPIMALIIIFSIILGIAIFFKKKKKSSIISIKDSNTKSVDTLPPQIVNDVKYCSQCGTPQKLTAIYCIKCGNKID